MNDTDQNTPKLITISLRREEKTIAGGVILEWFDGALNTASPDGC